MEKRSQIADVSQALVAVLRKILIPDVLERADDIQAVHPQETGGSRLGVYLYDIRESRAIRNTDKQWNSADSRRMPSVYVDLYYMLFPCGKTDPKYRWLEEQKIWSSLIPLLRDAPFLDRKTGEWGSIRTEDPLILEALNMEYGERTQIWNALNLPIQTAAYYRVASVELPSGREETVRRVRELEFRVGEEARHG